MTRQSKTRMGKPRSGLSGYAAVGMLMLTALGMAPASHADDEADQVALMAMLNTETEVATRNKMNADFVPGMVSVMQGDDLRKLGARNAAEALGYVPGIYVTEGNAGDYRVQVRGVGTSLGGSNIKILLNGMSMNSATYGTADSVLRIPIEQVERIVVVRGPGSALYGEYALTGLVDIVLRHDEKVVGVGTGGHSYRQGDVISHGGDAEGVQWQVNGSAWARAETGRTSELDNFGEGSGLGNSPGPLDDDLDGRLLKAGMSWHGFQLSTLFVQSRKGGFTGRNGVSAIDTDPAYEKKLGVELKKQWQASDRADITLSASTLHTYQGSADELGIPKGGRVPAAPPGTFATEDGYRSVDVHGRQMHTDLQGSFQLSRDNTLIVGAGYSELQILNTSGVGTQLGVSVIDLPDAQVPVQPSDVRKVRSAYIQDQWRATSNLEFTLGGRYDDYDDWGGSASPRFAAVWQMSDTNILKMQYAGAFRPPTLAESNPGGIIVPQDLVAEELTSTELSYIYRYAGRIFRATLFKTDIDDLLEYVQVPGQLPTYANRGKILSHGAELEWEQYFDRRWKLMSNVSWVEAEDTNQDRELTGNVNWLGNVGLGWDATANLTVTGTLRYVGEQEGWHRNGPIQAVGSYDPYTTVGVTLRCKNFAGVRGMTGRLGASNIFNADYHTVPYPDQYPEGLVGTDADWWLAIEYDFGGR